MRFSANISLMYEDLPFHDRAARARDDGFTAVECWWPFSTAQPDAADVSTLLGELARMDLTLTAMNLYAGDMAGGDRGVLSHPDAATAFSSSLAVLADIVRDSDCRTVNALYGHRLASVDPQTQDAVAADRLRTAADLLGILGAEVVVEPLTNGQNGTYPILTLQDALTIADATGRTNVKPLFDAYHLHNNGADVTLEFTTNAHRIGHVQIADAPGRGRPGSGGIDFPSLYAAIESSGYTGWVGCEYRETTLRGAPVEFGAGRERMQ